ncbi:hypothetical protein PGIGA_G00094810 [Pangasianodon gigas]|uniref:Uncharacterized protein n=1 Tax=Pangasianodon gigas TaxID=30993 RepID=A0ACC5XEC5_PANGG|nr:hypothetical protein [Pangasianodon gigas]
MVGVGKGLGEGVGEATPSRGNASRLDYILVPRGVKVIRYQSLKVLYNTQAEWWEDTNGKVAKFCKWWGCKVVKERIGKTAQWSRTLQVAWAKGGMEGVRLATRALQDHYCAKARSYCGDSETPSETPLSGTSVLPRLKVPAILNKKNIGAVVLHAGTNDTRLRQTEILKKDFRSLIEKRPRLYRTDGLHPSRVGAVVLSDNISRTLRTI